MVTKEQTVCVIGSNSISGATFIRCCLESGFRVVGVSRSPELHQEGLSRDWLVPASGVASCVGRSLGMTL